MKKISYLIIITALLASTAKSFFGPINLTLAEDPVTRYGIVITEINATAPANLEWIEVQNLSDEAVNLENWKFFENATNHGLTLFEGDMILRSNEIAIIANRADELKTAFPTLDVTIFDSSWTSLKTEGEEIGLKNETGEFTELFTYIPNMENSLQRIDNFKNDYSATNWVNSPNTIGKENLNSELILTENILEEIIPATADTDSSTPATPDTQSSKTIPATPDTDNEKTGTANISEQEQTPSAKFPNAIITIQSGVTTAYNKVTLNIDGTNSSDPNGETLTYFWDFGDGYIYEKKNPPSHSYKEIGTYLVTLRVTNQSGLFHETTLTIKVLEEETVEKKSESSQKTENSNDKNQEETSLVAEPEVPPSPEEKPAQTSHPALLLNEILPNPLGRDDGLEWVEIYNPNDFAVNTKGYSLDDYTDKGSSAMKLKEIEILPKSHYLIYDPTVSLNNSDEEIQLLDPNGTLLDKVFFGKSFEGQSYARMKSEWLWTTFPTPNFANEIVSEELEISAKENKESAFTNGDLSSEIYISEILPNPLGEDAPNEWIELYNDGNFDINLGNWVLDDNENGSKPYALPDTLNIRAKSHIVIERPESKISLDNRQDTVRLINFEEEIQDEIFYEKAKENLSFAKMSIIYEDKIETEWTWTPIITKNGTNPKLYKIKGEIEEKNAETIFIKAKTLKLQDNNELTDITLSPGNLVELTYDDNDEIKEYTLIRQKDTESTPEKTKKTSEIIKIALLVMAAGIYAYRKRKRNHDELQPKNM